MRERLPVTFSQCFDFDRLVEMGRNRQNDGMEVRDGYIIGLVRLNIAITQDNTKQTPLSHELRTVQNGECLGLWHSSARPSAGWLKAQELGWLALTVNSPLGEYQ